MSATKEHLHDQIEAGQRGKQHKISWLNMPGYKPETWNPIVGCSKVSPGCDNCYAERMAFRIAQMQLKNHGKNGYHYSEVSKLTSIGWTGVTRLVKEALDKPLTWKTPRVVFVCSMSDLFHESVSSGMFQMVLDRISRYRQHIFILLTKRPENVMPLMKRVGWGLPFPPNVWLGVTAENQEQANKRIPLLLQIPAAKRFVSIEPMLGRVNIAEACKTSVIAKNFAYGKVQELHWVICGGESGPKARSMHPDWVRSVRDQCASANVPFFFKQWGEWLPFDQNPAEWVTENDAKGIISFVGENTHNVISVAKYGKKVSGDLLDGKQHHNWPNP